MTELSLHVLDVVENSIHAGATLIEITICAKVKNDVLMITITDNGCGMTNDVLEHVTDPFFTTRKTRKVGLGIPFFRYAALSCGGHFSITSHPGAGTKVEADFSLSHIDRLPLGDITGTMYTLITCNTQTDFVYIYKIDDRTFTLDTRQVKEILDGIPLNTPEVLAYLKEYLTENKKIVDNGYIL